MFKLNAAVYLYDHLKQGWGTYGPREHLMGPASEFSLPKLQYRVQSELHDKQVLRQ